MAESIGAFGQQTLSFLRTYVIPYLLVLAIAFVTILIALALLERDRKRSIKRTLRAEIRTNAKVTKAIVTYADAQLSGDTSVAPIPKYRIGAYLAYVNAGLLDKIPHKLSEELQQMYLSIVSVNRTGRRAEELAFGPAAAFPNAHTLRLENLTYARDTAHNIIEPYQDRLRDIKL